MYHATTFSGFLAMIGPQQLLIIAGVLLLLFGGSKVPELMRGLGQGICEFKSAANETSPVSISPALPATSLEKER